MHGFNISNCQEQVRQLASELAMIAVDIPSDLTRRETNWPSGGVIHAEAEMWRSPGAILRLATIAGSDCRIANLAFFPLSSSLPMVQFEYVEVRGRVLVALADTHRLSESAPSFGEDVTESIKQVFENWSESFPPIAERPSWTEGLISSDALWTRTHTEGLPTACSSVVEGIMTRLGGLAPYLKELLPDEGLPQRTAFRRVFLENEPSRPFLIKLFGSEWAEAFMEGVLFPISLTEDLSVATR